jgi:lactate 2-monooxygenase
MQADANAARQLMGPGRYRQTEVFVAGIGGARPLIPAQPAELKARALSRMTPLAAAYIAGGAGSEATMRANRRAFEAQEIVPRVLRDVTQRDLSVTLLGKRHAVPMLLAPVGVLELVDPQADLAVARAAAAEGVGYIFSNQASVPMEDCAAAMGSAPRWFQLYWSSDDEFVASLLARAEKAGCEALVVTLDTTLLGWRPRDLDLGYLPFLRGMGLAQYLSDPVFRAKIPARRPDLGMKPKGVKGLIPTLMSHRRKAKQFGLPSSRIANAAAYFTATYSRLDITWADIARLRRMTSLPILLKGLRHPGDARLAREHGIDGVIVSNHGGRQVDGEAATLDMLPKVVEAAGDMPVLLDSGVRSGRDVAVALALGARAVLIGRPYVYALALAGEAGVRELIRNMIAEFDLTLALSGLRRPAELTPDCLASAVLARSDLTSAADEPRNPAASRTA